MKGVKLDFSMQCTNLVIVDLLSNFLKLLFGHLTYLLPLLLHYDFRPVIIANWKGLTLSFFLSLDQEKLSPFSSKIRKKCEFMTWKLKKKRRRTMISLAILVS